MKTLVSFCFALGRLWMGVGRFNGQRSSYITCAQTQHTQQTTKFIFFSVESRKDDQGGGDLVCCISDILDMHIAHYPPPSTYYIYPLKYYSTKRIWKRGMNKKKSKRYWGWSFLHVYLDFWLDDI